MHEALAKLLDQYDARRRDDSAREQRAKDDDTQFLARFAQARHEVIRPVFEAAAAALEARGHTCTIAEEEFSRAGHGRSTEASISMHIEPAGMQASQPSDEHARTLTIATRHYNRTLWVNAGRPMDAGGMAGSKGALPLERMNAQLVEDELVKLVETVLAG